MLLGFNNIGHFRLCTIRRNRHTALLLYLLLLLLRDPALLLGLLPHETAQVEVEVVLRQIEQFGALFHIKRPLDVVFHAADRFQYLVYHGGPLDGIVASLFRQNIGLEKKEIFGFSGKIVLQLAVSVLLGE